MKLADLVVSEWGLLVLVEFMLGITAWMAP